MKKKKIFVADDDPDILEIISIILEDYGYEVEKANSGQKLLKLKENFPDLILLDISMAGEDGSEICKKLKQLHETKDIPVLLVSANRNLELAATQCYANGYVSKPFDVEYLLSKVKEYA